MGDRGHVRIEYPERKDWGHTVWFYTHWTGSSLPGVVQAALKRSKDRWDDVHYLPRIIFSELIKGQENGKTGFGIAPFPADTGDGGRVVEVELENQFVNILRQGYPKRSYSFREYCQLGEKDLEFPGDDT